MNAMNKMLILFLVTSFFVTGANIEGVPVYGSGSPVQTYISAWPGSYFYLDSDTVEIEVSIWDENGQSVNTGTINVNDLNSTSGGSFTVSSQVTNVSLTADSNGIVGVHVFEVTYEDVTDTYAQVTTTLNIIIGRTISQGATGTTVEVDYPSYSITKGQEISVTGDLTSDHPAIPYFFIDPNTAYISLEANIEGDWKIIEANYLSTGIITAYDFDFTAVFPFWTTTGVINSRIVFSGSDESNLAGTTTSFTINLLSSVKSVVVSLPSDTVERNSMSESHNLVMDIQVPGFDGDPVEIDVNLLTSGDVLVKNLITGQPVTEYNSQLFPSFSNDIPVGNYTLSTILIDSNTDIVLATDNKTINLTDDLLLDNFFWDVDNQIISPDQYIQGYLVSREEDTFIGAQSDLQIDIQGNVLFDGTTDASGYINFDATIPGYLTSGYYDVTFTLSALPGSYHTSIVEVFPVVIPENTTISHQENSNLVRNGDGWFNATVLDEGSIPVGTGSLSLTLGETLLHESVGGTANYEYTVPQDATRGINVFTWTYTGDGYYNDSSQNIPVTIFSKPSFINLSSSISELVPGGSLELRGQLIEETTDPVIGETIHVTQRDNWGTETEFTLLTDGDGWFTINFNPDVDDVGTYFFTVEYTGNSGNYYLPIDGSVIFEVSVSPPISLQVSGPVIAGESSTLVFEGKPDQNVDLEIFEADSWIELAVIPLNSEGTYQYDWIPDNGLKGNVLLRATYSDGQGESIFTVNVKVRPELNLEIVGSSFFTNQEITIQVSGSETHDIWLDGQLWQADLSSGSRQFLITFNEPGDHDIEVNSSGLNIIDTSISETIQVRENYTITADFPDRVQKGVTFHLEILVENDAGPLEGFTVELYKDDTLIATSVTSQLGIATIDTTLTNGNYNLNATIIPLDDTIHLSREVDLGNVTVYTVPSMEIEDIEPVKGESVDVQILVTDTTDPVVNETINLYIETLSGDENHLIGTALTNTEGIATITWNVTEDSGDYYLKVENTGNEFLESIVTSKAVYVLETGPQITLASITEINRDQNIFSVTAIVDFPSGSGNVYLCSEDKTVIKELQAEGSIWITSIQLDKGTHDFWLKAVDDQGLEAWYDMESVEAVTDLSTEPQTGGSGETDGDKMQDTIRDTLISLILMTPVGGVVAYRKRKSLKSSKNS